VDGLLLDLQQSGLGQAMRSSRWLYPAVNTAHILGLALMFGSLVVLHLRTLALSRGPDLASLDRLVTPIAATGLALAIASGAAMFSTDAVKYAASTLLVTKMALVAAGILNVAWLKRQRAAKPAALVSLIVWVAVIVCGRLLGYT
jgi:hypothetical protein